ncbi:neuropeptide FF receptor 2-like [Branchiostoma lanceolatum]|uniref:neuropeptide FF receptor 2-like n=1 Tax=Branchiostoma lanceolatum TaxID=7740 RepID=UPI0034559477
MATNNTTIDQFLQPVETNASSILDLKELLEKEMTRPLLTALLMAFAYSIIFLVCLVGNLIVCVMILKSKRTTSATDYFIFNLAICDLLVGIFCIPFTLVSHVFPVLSLGPFACKFIPLAQGVAVGASVFTLMAIAYDRYRLVIHPSNSKAPVKYWASILAGVWVSAVSVMVPQAIVREEISHLLPGGHIKVCQEFWPSYTQQQAYSAALLACCYLGPLVISACLYLMVAVTLRRRKSTNNTMHASQRFNKVTKMLVIVIVLFTLSWIPLYACWMVEDFGELTPPQKIILHDYVYPFAHWLAFSNSCVNPLLYGYFNKSLRKRFRDSLVRRSDNEITGGNISLKIKANVNRKAILKYRRNSNKPLDR